jgi:Phage capsid family
MRRTEYWLISSPPLISLLTAAAALRCRRRRPPSLRTPPNVLSPSNDVLPHVGAGVSLKGIPMFLNKAQVASRRVALNVDAQTIYQQLVNGQITESAFNKSMSRLEAEAEKLNTAEETHFKAHSFAGLADSKEFSMMNKMIDGGFAENSRVKQIDGVPKKGVQVTRNLSPADLDEQSLQQLYSAMQNRTPFTVNLKGAQGETGGFASRAGSKAIAASPMTEGIPSFSGLLPPVIRPDLYTEYLYDVEPRLADYLPSIEIEDQEIALPVEGRPTNQPTDQSSPVPAVSELGSLADAGLNWTSKVYRPIKLAVLGSLSTELVDDASIFTTLVPKTLSNALYAEEAFQILYGSGTSPQMTGLANTAGILSLPASALMYSPSTDTLIDALTNASSVLRETPNLYQPATLILLNPSDWSGIKRIKNSLGDYVLSTISPNTVLADLDNIMGIRVVEVSPS